MTTTLGNQSQTLPTEAVESDAHATAYVATLPSPFPAGRPSPLRSAVRAVPSARSTYERTKRAIDIVVALAFLVAFVPILAIAAAAIRLESPGPIFYRAMRVGRDGRPVRVLKLRSMFVDAEQRLAQLLSEGFGEEFGRAYKLRDDPRQTRVGRLLRRTSIDEIPQFWNVVVGEMSLVGPRPVTIDELALYEAVEGGLDAYLSVRPGITGLWQVSGRSNLTYQERVSLDKAYVASRSLRLDLRILVKTPLAVIRGEGAY